MHTVLLVQSFIPFVKTDLSFNMHDLFGMN